MPKRSLLRSVANSHVGVGAVNSNPSAPGPFACRKPSYSVWSVDGKRFGNLITIRLYMDTADGYLSDVVAAIVSADGRTLRGVQFDPAWGPAPACALAFRASFVQEPPAKD